ncbi:TonB-dependent siderophore receptor [Vibrio sp. H11]|uniref:TonB-dependent siderophore receptor n=1 Tax=Vibrio sp. H11 TaxID=2565928 RepID=UPI0010A5B508|nr:TonB-dependent siderophore receptor [Vibrio sp. H11]
MAVVKHSTFSPIAVAIMAAFATPFALAAQADNPPVDTVTILGKTYRNTATKTTLAPQETPQGISVIEGEQLQQRAVTSLGQAVRYAPGVVTETKGGSVTLLDNFYIRGFESNQSYYDGMLVQYLKGWNLQPQIDPIAMQQVEIFKGPTSVLYGAMPPGGMVNVIAKKPQPQRHTELSVSGGSRNLKQVTLDTTGPLGDGDLRYRLLAKSRKQDGQVDGTEEERYVIAPSLDWQITDDTLLNLNLYYQKDPDMGMNSALPASGTVTGNPYGSTSPSTSAGDRNWSKFEREFWMLGYKIQHDFNAEWSLLQSLRYTDATLYQENTYHSAGQFDAVTGNLQRNIYSTDEDSHGIVVDNQLSGQVSWGSVEHNLLLGIDYQRLKGNSDYRTYQTTESDFGAFNLFAPDNNLLDRSSLTQTDLYAYDISIKQLGFYFQDQLRWNRWVLIGGGRFDHYTSSSEVSGYSTDADDNEFTYRVGALYEFDSGLAPFASFATSFSPVAGVDSQFGQPFKPETGEQVEVGVKYQSADMSKQGSISLYHILKNDVVVTDPSSADYQDDIQVGEVRSQGIEVEGRWWVTPGWDIAASYTYSDVEVTKDSANGLQGTTPIYVPEHSATLWSTYQIDQGVLDGSRVSAGARYVGSMMMDATNTQGKVPDYTMVDLSLGYDLGKISERLQGVSADVIASNLLDEKSYTCYDNMNCWYGAERTIEVKLGYQF